MTPELEKAFKDFEDAKGYPAKVAAFDALLDAGSHDPEAAKQAVHGYLENLPFDFLKTIALNSAAKKLRKDVESVPKL
jgi:hypothetical protein